ncbi:hypothetical protein AVEN_15355-1, partial [Araneus ventricosus]
MFYFSRTVIHLIGYVLCMNYLIECFPNDGFVVEDQYLTSYDHLMQEATRSQTTDRVIKNFCTDIDGFKTPRLALLGDFTPERSD